MVFVKLLFSFEKVRLPSYHLSLGDLLGDETQFSLAEVTGSFKFKILLKGAEIFFTSYLHDPQLLYLNQI